MNWLIRKYSDGDLDDVLLAWESASRVGHPFLSEQFLGQERLDIANVYLPNSETWVIEQDGRVFGFIALLGNEVGAIFVKPQFHRSGAGKALMDKAQALCGDIEVEVFEKNVIGRRFYAKYGFVPLSESVHKETGFKLLRLKFVPQSKL